jgi:hypothetical protein
LPLARIPAFRRETSGSRLETGEGYQPWNAAVKSFIGLSVSGEVDRGGLPPRHCNIDLKNAAVTTLFVIVLTLARVEINVGSTSVAAGKLWYSSTDGVTHGR